MDGGFIASEYPDITVDKKRGTENWSHKVTGVTGEVPTPNYELES